MNEYEVVVTEKLVKKLRVHADTKEQVLEKIQHMIRLEKLVLTADDFTEREIDVVFKSDSSEASTKVPEEKPKVSFYVACCGEYHSMAPMYEDILDAEEALKIYDRAVKKYSAFIPEIGIKVSHKDFPEEDIEWGLLQGNVLDLSLLDCVEEIVNTDSALHLIGELVSAVKDTTNVVIPGCQINGECLALNKAMTTT